MLLPRDAGIGTDHRFRDIPVVPSSLRHWSGRFRQLRDAEQFRRSHTGSPVFSLRCGIFPLCFAGTLPALCFYGRPASTAGLPFRRNNAEVINISKKAQIPPALFYFLLISRQISRHFPHSPALQYRQNRERPPFPNLSGGAAHVGHAGPLASGGADRSQPTPAPKGIRSRTSGGAGGIHPPPWDHPAPNRPPQR